LSSDNNNINNINKKKSSGLRNVLALGLVSFFTDFSTEMVLGILPLFIVNNLGASRAILGAIEGSDELVSYAFRIVSGSLSDKVGKRKIFILAGYGLSTFSKPFFASNTGWLDAFVVRTTDRIGKGLRTAPRDALIADSVSESISGKAFGIHRTIDQMGAILGPIAAFSLLQIMDIRGVFFVSLFPGAIAVLILILFVKDIAIKRGGHSKAATTIFSNIVTVMSNNKPFVLLLFISGIFSFGAFNFSFVLLKASELGVDNDLIPIVYAVINISHTAIGIPAGILADKIGKEKVLIIGYSIFGVSTVLMAAISSAENSNYAFVLAAIFGLYIGISETVQRAVVPGYVSSELRGTAFGVYNVVLGTSFFVSNVVFGFLWDNYNLNAAVAYSIILTSAAIIGMFVFISRFSINKMAYR
jgi:MFS family permease